MTKKIEQIPSMENSQNPKKKLGKLGNAVAAGMLVALTAQPAMAETKYNGFTKEEVYELAGTNNLTEQELQDISELFAISNASLAKAEAEAAQMKAEAAQAKAEAAQMKAEAAQAKADSKIHVKFSGLAGRSLSCLLPGNEYGLKVSDFDKQISQLSDHISDPKNLETIIRINRITPGAEKSANGWFNTMLNDSRLSNKQKQKVREIMRKLELN